MIQIDALEPLSDWRAVSLISPSQLSLSLADVHSITLHCMRSTVLVILNSLEGKLGTRAARGFELFYSHTLLVSVHRYILIRIGSMTSLWRKPITVDESGWRAVTLHPRSGRIRVER